VLAGLVDFDAERARLQKEREKLAVDEAKLAKKLSNQGFLAKAPADVVEKERAKEGEYQTKLASLREHLELFK
ncbi:MAG: hypothetical protein Q4B50_07835, partial [Bacillota bacterium]|nr:hypothetical protein [Bacillota bacterium]